MYTAGGALTDSTAVSGGACSAPRSTGKIGTSRSPSSSAFLTGGSPALWRPSVSTTTPSSLPSPAPERSRPAASGRCRSVKSDGCVRAGVFSAGLSGVLASAAGAGSNRASGRSAGTFHDFAVEAEQFHVVLGGQRRQQTDAVVAEDAAGGLGARHLVGQFTDLIVLGVSRFFQFPAALRVVAGLVVRQPMRRSFLLIVPNPGVELGVAANVAGQMQGADQAQLVHRRPLRVGHVHAVGAVHGDEDAAAQLVGLALGDDGLQAGRGTATGRGRPPASGAGRRRPAAGPAAIRSGRARRSAPAGPGRRPRSGRFAGPDPKRPIAG